MTMQAEMSAVGAELQNQYCDLLSMPQNIHIKHELSIREMDPPTRGCWDLNPGPSRPQILIKVSLPSCHCLRKVRYICSATRPTDMFALNLFIVLLPLKFGVVSSVWKFP